MYFNKYSSGQKSVFDSKSPSNTLKMAIVVTVGKTLVRKDSKADTISDVNFNADTHAIKCRIVGSDYDNTTKDIDLPNCFPLLPKHLNLVPKVGEVVLVMTLNDDNRHSDRFYVGPISSSMSRLNIDRVTGTALSNFGVGITESPKELDKVVTAKGIYENPQHLVIHGRNNTDFIQRDNEILMRAGKFILDKPEVFNGRNPSYIQLKYNQSYKNDKVSVTNIVSDKINLLTYNGSDKLTKLTYVDPETNEPIYINDEDMGNILDTAHPIVFGDVLIKYLKLLKNALVNHVHNGNGNKSTDRTDGPVMALDQFVTASEILEEKMLSKNIKVN